MSWKFAPLSRYWAAEGWVKVLILTGWILFWLAGVAGDSVPLEALFVGPVLMLAGVAFIMRNRGKAR